jgi:ABC-type phosphate transport system permease subunit
MAKKFLSSIAALVVLAATAVFMLFGIKTVWPVLILLVIVDFCFERKWIPDQYRGKSCAAILVAAWGMLLWDCVKSLFF